MRKDARRESLLFVCLPAVLLFFLSMIPCATRLAGESSASFNEHPVKKRTIFIFRLRYVRLRYAALIRSVHHRMFMPCDKSSCLLSFARSMHGRNVRIAFSRAQNTCARHAHRSFYTLMLPLKRYLRVSVGTSVG